MITLRRVYEQEKTGEEYRVLVDRLWPRGISKEKARWHEWMKEIAPSSELRRWYGHDPSKWEKFRQLYWEELAGRQEEVKRLKQLEKQYGTLTLLYSSAEEEYNNASALKEFLSLPGNQLL